MDNKSSAGRDLRSAPPVQESPQVKAGGACCEVGTGSETPYKRIAPGSEGPGMGSAKKLNSDDQMPGPSYG